MWADFKPRALTREQLAARIAALSWTDWHPVGIVLHNTAAPTLQQWVESGPAHDARIANLQRYYEGMGWHGGPHWFVSRNWINEFNNPLRRGTHSPSFNATHFGIEMVGDYDREAFDAGDGALVRDNAVFLMAALCRKFGWDIAKVLKLHKEDPRTTHDCPGKQVSKADVIVRVKAELVRASNAAPDTTPPPRPTVPVPVPPPATKDQRTRMAQAIVNFEARRDKAGHLQVYHPPANDGGGSYEVAGLNETYDKPVADQVIALLKRGQYDQAEAMAVEAIAQNTDFAASMTRVACLESYLRDCIFNRGKAGAIKILQLALGFPGSKASARAVDGTWGPQTLAATRAAETDPRALLHALRAARERYEREWVGYRANFWPGLVNRWDGALKVALTFADAPIAAPRAAAGLATGALLLAGGAGVAAHGAGLQPWQIVLIVAGIALAGLAGLVSYKKQAA